MRTLMGVVHLPALPSAARSPDFETVFLVAMRDGERLVAGGCDALMVENFGDAPFHKGSREDPVPPDVPAALAVVARALRERLGVRVGINCLRNDGVAAVGAAAVADARFVRVNVLAGTSVADQGILDSEAARIDRYRKRVAPRCEILADLMVKHAQPLAPPDLATAARDLAGRSGASGLVLTGSRTGEPVSVDLVESVREAVGSFPVWIGSGLDADNAAQLWPRCDGAIVGTYCKYGGETTAPVDPARVARLRAACAVGPR